MHLSELRKGVGDARQAHADCVYENSHNDVACAESKISWEKAKGEMAEFRKSEYRDRQNGLEETTEAYEILAVRHKVERNRYNEAIGPMIELEKQLVELNSRVLDLYRDYMKLEGATGQIIWSISWDRLLEAYRQMNQQYRVNWQPLPLKESEFIGTVKLKETGTELSNLSAIKSVVVPGAKYSGFSGMGSGNRVDGVHSEPSLPTLASLTFGTSISGQIVFTLAGACPYFDSIAERATIDVDELTKSMTANLIYSFEAAVRRGYTTTYNLSSLLSKIEEKSRRGGFFSTTEAHSVLDEGNSSEWFSIKFLSNSSQFNYTREEQNQITRTLKQELFDKAFRQFAILNAGSSQPPAAPEFLQSGSSRASAELRKCWHYYCQAGSAILGVANSIWGKSRAVAAFYNNNNVWVTEKIDGIEFVDRSSSLTFGAE